MRIVFNLQNVGLGNNGGSRTIIKCAETLQHLGHSVWLSTDANRYKWHKIQVEVTRKIPKSDVIVATGFGSVNSTLKAKALKKFYYIRGFEIWRTSKRKLLSSYRSLSCIVNSEWLLKYFQSKGIKASLVYPGLDFADFKIKNTDRSPVIGGIFSKKHKTKRHKDVVKVGEMTGCKVKLLNKDIVNPTPKQLRNFYNNIMIWVSPSELEGLHNCPMEASLCGCGLVVSDHIRSGTSDYAVPNETCLQYKSRDLESAANKVTSLINNSHKRNSMVENMCDLLSSKIGDRKSNMKKMVEIFERSG